jgi:hypothetical protein
MLRSLLRRPLLWLLMAVGIALVFSAGALQSHQDFKVGEWAERLYLLKGFSGVEQRASEPYRWTAEQAAMSLPLVGPGHLTVHLKMFDAAPAPRRLRVWLDGREIYSGLTRVGGQTYDLSLAGVVSGTNALLTLDTEPWSRQGDRRTLGIAITGVGIDSPDAGRRALIAEAAYLLAVLALVAAISYRTGRTGAALVGGLAALSLGGLLLVYGDVWLVNSAGAFLALSLVASGLIVRGIVRIPKPRGRGALRVPMNGATAGGGAWKAPLWSVVALVAILLLLTMGRFNTGDAEAMYQVTAGIAEDGVPWLHDSHQWIKYGLGQPVATLPLYWLGSAWAGLGQVDPGPLTRFCVALFNQAIVPATALVLFLGARRRFGADVGLVLAGLYLLATPAIAYARLAFAEPLSGLLILSAALLLWPPAPDRPGARESAYCPSPRAMLGAGLLLGLAVLVKPANAIYIPVPALYVAWLLFKQSKMWRRVAAGLAWLGAGLLPGLVLVGAYDAMRYGSPLVFGYEHEGFTTPVVVGLYGLLFSPGKGIIYFAPPVLLAVPALWRWWRLGNPLLRAEALFIATQAAIVLTFYAAWSSWAGNIAWGPRLILPVVPLLLWPIGALLEAGSKWNKVACWALGVAGFVVAIPGALVNMFYYFDINGVYQAGTVAENNMFFNPTWSQIVAQWRFLLTGVREPMMRPDLGQLGLPAAWDTVVPVALLAVALAALVGLAGVVRRPVTAVVPEAPNLQTGASFLE